MSNPSPQLPPLPVRFFAYVQDDEGQTEIAELTESAWLALHEEEGGEIKYARHTVRENGCSQICLTLEF